MKPATTAEYKVRFVVRRPADAARFNGVVIVEWLNVSGLQEGAADYMQMKEEIEREGYAWVGIGAQAAGVNTPRVGLKAWDPERYGALIHPGDAYSYDIFSQGTQAILHPKGVDPLGGLRVRHAIATGRSQSAFRLVTYINAFHPRTHIFNGFLVHSRGANAAGLTAEQLGRDPEPIPAGAHIRTDIDVPVFDLQTEGDMVTLRAHLTRQEPNPHYQAVGDRRCGARRVAAVGRRGAAAARDGPGMQGADQHGAASRRRQGRAARVVAMGGRWQGAGQLSVDRAW